MASTSVRVVEALFMPVLASSKGSTIFSNCSRVMPLLGGGMVSTGWSRNRASRGCISWA